MSIKLSAPIIEDFFLDKSEAEYGDGSEAPAKISVRQANQGDNERRSRVFAEISRIIENEERAGTSMQIRQRWSMEELKRVEVFLTLAACDIMGSDDSPLFRFNSHSKLAMNENEFNRSWALLPPAVAAEIHEKVLKINYPWSAQGED